MKKTLATILGTALFAALVFLPAASLSAASKSKKKDKDAATATASTKAATSSKPATAAATAASAPSASDIASAKSKGLVWFNVNTKVYHYSSDKVYGTTKNGKFVTEADAKAAGGKPAGGGSAAPASAPAKAAAPAPAPAPVRAAAPAPAPTPAPVAAATPAAKTSAPKAAKTPPPPPPNAGEIAAAKAQGLVWLNLNTKVYHNSGDREYGTTKHGKFITEAEAKASGAKLASK